MTEVVRFEPIDVQPGELLQRGFSERPALILSEEHPEVYLGRGMKTGIDDLNVHHKMAKLCWFPSTAKVVLQIGSSKGERNYSTALSVNGELPQWKHHPMIGGGMIVELNDGDVIAVEGSGDPTPILYQYQVVMSTSGSASHHIEDDPPPTITASIPSPFKALGDETMCPLCMDIQVQSHFFVPCGHSFCHACVSPSPATCSICRVPVQKQTPNLVLDNMIWKMIEIQTATTGASSYHYYDDDDIQQYLLRSGKTLPSKTKHHQTSATPTSPPPRRGRRQAACKTEDLVGHYGTPSSVQRKRKRIDPEDSRDQIIGSFQGRSRESAICID